MKLLFCSSEKPLIIYGHAVLTGAHKYREGVSNFSVLTPGLRFFISACKLQCCIAYNMCKDSTT